MSLLRILRNFAALVILTVGGFTLIPPPVAAQSTCHPLGAFCNSTAQCCPGSLCGFRRTCCDRPLEGEYCTTSAQCCDGFCFEHRCGG
jgi:hypothetical protein